MPRRWAALWLVVHLGLILLVASRDTFDIFSRSETLFPQRWSAGFRSLADLSFRAVGGNLGSPNPLRNFVRLYLHAAGIDAGYGFFAPNIPSNYKIVFELHYPDGRVDYDIPSVASRASGLRLTGLLDFLAETDSEEVRSFMLKTLTESAWREHPEVTSIETLLGVGVLPTPEEYRHGQRERYEVMSRYSFAFRKRSPDESSE